MTTKPQALQPFREGLMKAQEHFAMALPATARQFLTPERMTKIMLSAISRNPSLAKCTVPSILNVCMTGASLGLEPAGPLGHLYAVPYHNNKIGKMEAMPIIGYRGFLELARRSDKITSIEAHVVYNGDDFDVEFGMDPKLKHKPKLKGDRGEVVAGYCIARFRDGSTQCEFMTRTEIDAVRKRSRAANNGPWVTDFEEMARKTVVRRAAKYWPLSTELAKALAVEGEVERAEPISVTIDDLPGLKAAAGEDPEPQTRAEEVKERLKKGNEKWKNAGKAESAKPDVVESAPEHDPQTGEVKQQEDFDFRPPPMTDEEVAAMSK